jgi:hypothetical protein
VFDEISRQIDEDFPNERQQSQVSDTYALCVNVAKESLIDLLRHPCQRLLATLRKIDTIREAMVRATLDSVALFGAKDEPSEFHLPSAERAAGASKLTTHTPPANSPPSGFNSWRMAPR